MLRVARVLLSVAFWQARNEGTDRAGRLARDVETRRCFRRPREGDEPDIYFPSVCSVVADEEASPRKSENGGEREKGRRREMECAERIDNEKRRALPERAAKQTVRCASGS